MGKDLPISGEGEVARLKQENAVLQAALADLHEKMAQLENQIDRDPLTDLPNRRYFLDAMRRVIAHVDRHNLQAIAMFVDLTNLEEINDAHGRAAGDAAIMHVARLLHGHIRITDVAARIGGDAFGLLLDHIGSDDADRKARALEALIAENPLQHQGHIIRLSVAIGMTTLKGDDKGDDALSRADVSSPETRQG